MCLVLVIERQGSYHFPQSGLFVARCCASVYLSLTRLGLLIEDIRADQVSGLPQSVVECALFVFDFSAPLPADLPTLIPVFLILIVLLLLLAHLLRFLGSGFCSPLSQPLLRRNNFFQAISHSASNTRWLLLGW